LAVQRTDTVPQATVGPAPATGEGRRFQRHAFVCLNAEACARDGPAEAIFNDLKGRLKASGRKEELRVNKSGCLGQCGHGPMMVVYPEGVWYCHLSLLDADRIWGEHILGGRPVADLQYKTEAAGTNVLGRQSDGSFLPVGGPHSSRCSRCPP
jgi:(2Fe-2S) ferredoxin